MRLRFFYVIYPGSWLSPGPKQDMDVIALTFSTRLERTGSNSSTGGGYVVFAYGDARYWTPPAGSKVVFVASFPVCTNMAGSGAQDYSNLNGRIPKKGIPQLCDGLLLFNACYFAGAWSGAPFLVENPSGVIPTHFRACDYTFHPWFFGDDYQKLTCVWAGNGFVMPEREYISKPEGTTQKIWDMPPGADRQNKRSETPAGFARAVFEANHPKTLIEKVA